MNYAVTVSVFEAFITTRVTVRRSRSVASSSRTVQPASGRGYYDYRDGAEKPGRRAMRTASPSSIARSPCSSTGVDATVHMHVASPADIETSMTKGELSQGLLAWATEIDQM
jgi:hypothetical protein